MRERVVYLLGRLVGRRRNVWMTKGREQRLRRRWRRRRRRRLTPSPRLHRDVRGGKKRQLRRAAKNVLKSRRKNDDGIILYASRRRDDNSRRQKQIVSLFTKGVIRESTLSDRWTLCLRMCFLQIKFSTSRIREKFSEMWSCRREERLKPNRTKMLMASQKFLTGNSPESFHQVKGIRTVDLQNEAGTSLQINPNSEVKPAANLIKPLGA